MPINPTVLQSARNIREIVAKARNRRLMAEEVLVVERSIELLLWAADLQKSSWWYHAINLFDKGFWGPRND